MIKGKALVTVVGFFSLYELYTFVEALGYKPEGCEFNSQ
jgi:hypothetical protein